MDLAYETVNIVYTVDCRTLSFIKVSTHEWNYSVIPSFSLNKDNISSNITHWVSVDWLYAVNWNNFFKSNVQKQRLQQIEYFLSSAKIQCLVIELELVKIHVTAFEPNPLLKHFILDPH